MSDEVEKDGVPVAATADRGEAGTSLGRFKTLNTFSSVTRVTESPRCTERKAGRLEGLDGMSVVLPREFELSRITLGFRPCGA